MSSFSEIYGGEGFVTDNYEKQDFSPIPPGWYSVVVEKAEIKNTNAGTGKYLSVQFCIYGQQYANRKLFTNINLLNPNQQAEEIGLRSLATLGAACGLHVIKDTEDLIDKCVQVRVKLNKEGDNNEISGYKAVDGAAPTTTPEPTPDKKAAPETKQQAPAAPQNTRTQAPTQPKKRPWEK